MYKINPIGKIESNFTQPADPFEMKKHESVIIINKEYEEGLFDIESNTHLEVFFVFHLSDGYKLKHINYFNEEKGVFAARSPKRPNSIGMTRVKLIKRDANKLYVTGLDAVKGTPVVDIKPGKKEEDEGYFDATRFAHLKKNPRKEIIGAVKSKSEEFLLTQAGSLHGHFCPGLALGVRAAVLGLNKLGESSDGMEDLLVITETNNCASDGIQFVSGCTFGNNALIFKDVGKNAFTFTLRNGKGIRVSVKDTAKAYMDELNSDFSKQFKKVVIEKNHSLEEKRKLSIEGVKASFNILNADIEMLFKVEYVDVEIPKYAPIHESIKCAGCGELTMGSRIHGEGEKSKCLLCGDTEYYELTGHGIVKKS